ncbi:MAG TPA: hypothetical protein PLW02_02335 [Verrucomicrobiota bacterium]|nr:hypothetical protein [Verrucomicrobiota bacterium]
MRRSIFKWIAIINIVIALVLAAEAVSQKKTIVSVKEGAMTTLTGIKDQHTDFVRHMLDFVTSETSKMTNMAFFTSVWLVVNAVVSWQCFGHQHKVGEDESSIISK